MLKVKALPKGCTRLSGTFKSMAGEVLAFCEVVDSTACRIAFNAYDGSTSSDIPAPSFDDIFGRIGVCGDSQWRVYRHAIHHIARF